MSGALDFGYRSSSVRAAGISVRLPIRLVLTSAVLALTAVAMAVVAIRFGDYPLTLGQVLDVLGGGGDSFHRIIVLEWRTPIALAALVFGALLGVGGAIFQSLTRNPLGSPDVIGFDAGAYTAVSSPCWCSEGVTTGPSRLPRSSAGSPPPSSSTCWLGGVGSRVSG